MHLKFVLLVLKGVHQGYIIQFFLQELCFRIYDQLGRWVYTRTVATMDIFVVFHVPDLFAGIQYPSKSNQLQVFDTRIVSWYIQSFNMMWFPVQH